MSTRTLKKTGAGTISQPKTIKLGLTGQLETQALAAMNAFNKALTSKINGRLSFGDGAQSTLTGNFFGQFIEFTTPSTPNEQFQIDHGLQKDVILRIVMRQNKAAHLYDSNLGGWGPRQVYFKCDVASTLFKVALFANPDS